MSCFGKLLDAGLVEPSALPSDDDADAYDDGAEFGHAAITDAPFDAGSLALVGWIQGRWILEQREPRTAAWLAGFRDGIARN